MQLPDVSSGFINCYGCQRLYHVSCSHQIGLYDEYLRFTCGCQNVVEATQYTVDDGFQTRKLGLDCQRDDSNEALAEANIIIAEYENPLSSVDPVDPVGPDTRKSYYFDYCPVGPVQEETFAARHSSVPSVRHQPTPMTSYNPRNYGVKRPAGSELMSEKVKSIRLSTHPGDKENTCPIATTTTLLLVPPPTQRIPVPGLTAKPKKNYFHFPRCK